MVQGQPHQAPHETCLEEIHPPCCSEQAPQHPPTWDLSPHRVLLGISKDLNAQHITTSPLPTASQWLLAVMELVNGSYWRVWYLTRFRSQAEAGEVTQQGLTPVQPGKSHPVLLAGKTPGHKHMAWCCTWRHLLLTQAGVTSPDPYKMPKTITNPWALLLMHNCLGCCNSKG